MKIAEIEDLPVQPKNGCSCELCNPGPIQRPPINTGDDDDGDNLVSIPEWAERAAARLFGTAARAT